MPRKIFLASLALAFAGCAAAMNGSPPPNSSAGREAVPAPIPSAASIRITAADAGKTIQAKVGDVIAVALVGVPTAGYVWAPDATPEFLVKTGEAGGPTSKAQSQPGFTGGNHWEVAIFEVRAPGAGALSLKQVRPWETDEPPVERFAVMIVASAR